MGADPPSVTRMPDLDGIHLDDRDFLLAQRLRDGASIERVSREFALAPATVLAYASRIRSAGVELPALDRSASTAADENQDQRTPGFSIQTTAKLSGVAASNLRIWELRYGWPEPTRLRNRYRVYSPELVMDLRRMKKLLEQGYRIGDLIVEGAVAWPDEPKGPVAKPPSRETRSLEKLPRPGDPRWAGIFDQVTQSLQRRQYGPLSELLERAALDLRSEGIVTGLFLPLVQGLLEQHAETEQYPQQVQTLLLRTSDLVNRITGRMPAPTRQIGRKPGSWCPEAVLALARYACRKQGYDLVEAHDGPFKFHVGAGVGRGGPFGIWLQQRLTLGALFADDASDLLAELTGEVKVQTA